jgi:DNA-directed RNA polymerase specialized sigma24 family protein
MGYGNTAGVDPAEEVARVATARRPRLLRLYRRRLRLEDLEDCYSQATLELLARSRGAPPFFASREHLGNLLELRFKSRIDDRRRAIEGRSAIEAALAHAVPVDAPGRGAAELEDRSAAVERQVLARTEVRRLRELIAELSRDQQLVLGSQVLVDIEPAEFCAQHGWSVEKYRKVAQRARAKLRTLVEEYERGERCRRLEPDLHALGAGAGEGVALKRARAHVSNCPNCARMVGELERNAHSALLPLPAAVAGGVGAKLAGAWAAVRRALGIARHPIAGTSGGAGVAGGSLASAGALKVGIAAVCVVGAAGSYVACSHLGVLPALGRAHVQRAAGHRRHSPAPQRHHRRNLSTEGAHTGTAATLSALTAMTPVPSRPTTTATVIEHRKAAAAPAHRRSAPRLTELQQIRREFDSSVGRAANARASGDSTSSRSTSASHRELAQIRREFGAPVARAASPAPPAAGATVGAAGSADPPAAAGTTPVTSAATSSAPSPGSAPVSTPAAAQPPPQTSGQARQAQAEFGFEK